jgi:hypothetical protein
VEGGWSSTPPSGPRRITQWSTANYPVVHGELTSGSQQTQLQKRSAAAPTAASDEEDDARAEKTKKSPMAAQISTS